MTRRVGAFAAALGMAVGAAAAGPKPALPEPPPPLAQPSPAPPPPSSAAEPQPAPEQPAAAQPAAPQAPAWTAPLVERREQGNLVFDGIPRPDPELAARLHRYLESRQAALLDWLPDGSLLIATRFGDTEQVHRVSAPLAAREQLTFYREPVSIARAAESGGFVFLMDQGGDENSQLYYRSADGGVRELTHGAFLHGSPVWAHDGRRVAFYGTDRDGASYDVYVAEVTSGAAPRLVVSGGRDGWYPLDWSADDGKLLVRRFVSIGESYLYIADVASGTLTPLDNSGHKIGIRDARFAPGSHAVYVLSDEDGEYAALRLIDPVTHQMRRITPELGWDVEAFDASADGRYLAYVVNQDGRSLVKLEDTQTHAEVSPSGLPEGMITRIAFERAGHRVGLSVESPEGPRDVYSYDTEHERLERWTRSEPGPLDGRALVAPELIRYPTWDRVAGHPRQLSAYVYRPRNAAHCPVVIDLHGGPESQFRPGWDPFIQFLVSELGMAVVAPNVRGSSGYGKSFLALDNGELREDAVRDVGSLLVWIGAQPAFDRERVSVMGTSYGGYMALASLAAYGQRLRGGIDVVGISNFVTPLTNASRIKRPLLVVEGLNDPRVPASESEQLVWRVRAAGGEVWYLTAKDEGHGFRKKVNRDAYLETAATFLQRFGR